MVTLKGVVKTLQENGTPLLANEEGKYKFNQSIFEGVTQFTMHPTRAKTYSIAGDNFRNSYQCYYVLSSETCVHVFYRLIDIDPAALSAIPPVDLPIKTTALEVHGSANSTGYGEILPGSTAPFQLVVTGPDPETGDIARVHLQLDKPTDSDIATILEKHGNILYAIVVCDACSDLKGLCPEHYEAAKNIDTVSQRLTLQVDRALEEATNSIDPNPDSSPETRRGYTDGVQSARLYCVPDESLFVEVPLQTHMERIEQAVLTVIFMSQVQYYGGYKRGFYEQLQRYSQPSSPPDKKALFSYITCYYSANGECWNEASTQCPVCKNWYCSVCAEMFIEVNNNTYDGVMDICPQCHYNHHR